jgi:hypothetical protein
MLFEPFFDIITLASGWVVGEIRRALARHNSVSEGDLSAGRSCSSRGSGHSVLGGSQPALASSGVCGQYEAAHSALP